MRLQLIAVSMVIGLCGAGPGAAVAQAQLDDEVRVEGSVGVYTDDDHVSVITPTARAAVPVTDDLGVDVALVVDVVSAASVDVVTQASPGPVEDQRVELGLGARQRLGRLTTVRLRAIGSRENDFGGLRLTGGVTTELAERNTVVDLGYTLGADRIGHRMDPSVDHRRSSHRVALALTQVVDPRTIVDLVVEGQLIDGYQASPYRRVPLVDPATPELMWVDERVPEQRRAAAGLGRVRRALGVRWFTHADYRFYADDWGMTSHTASVTASRSFPRGTLLGVTGRGYLQSAADFHEPEYRLVGGEAPALRTRDRTLGRVRSVYGTVSLSAPVGADRFERRPTLTLGLGIMRFWWLDYPAQAGRTAAIITVGAAF